MAGRIMSVNAKLARAVEWKLSAAVGVRVRWGSPKSQVRTL